MIRFLTTGEACGWVLDSMEGAAVSALTGVGVTWADVAGAAAVVAGVLGLVTAGALVAAMTMIRTSRRPKPDPSAVMILWRLGQLLRGGRGGGCWYSGGLMALMGLPRR
jgi:hypothetical protein